MNKAVLLSVHPKYAEMIVSGKKRVEFRRVWASEDVDTLVIYATSPVKRILGIARVKRIHIGSPSHMWKIAKKLNGGVTRDQLFKYLNGKASAIGIELEGIVRLPERAKPISLFGKNFKPPQSFRYLKEKEKNLLDSLI